MNTSRKLFTLWVSQAVLCIVLHALSTELLSVAQQRLHEHRHFEALALFAIALMTKFATLIAIYATGASIMLPTLSNFLRTQEPEPLPEKAVRSSHLNECLAIIKVADVQRLGLTNTVSKHMSRARPNQRLVTAFGISNCFTTTDEKLCKEFREQAEKLLYAEDSTWVKIAESIGSIVNGELSTAVEQFNIFSLIQMISMKSVLGPMFAFDTARHDEAESIRRLAQEINKQLLLSKEDFDPRSTPSWAFINQNALQQALKAVLPEWSGESDKSNPLNLILPGYETMWRVVLRGLIEVTTRSHPNSAKWTQCLQDFLQSPSIMQLDRHSATYGDTSADKIAKETLRLYPPTRRIYRDYMNANGRIFDVAADVEECHRSAVNWGDQPLVFRPERWKAGFDNDWENANFLPFGNKPFMCVAKQRPSKGKQLPFGVSMICMLVGMLAAAMQGKWRVVGKLP